MMAILDGRTWLEHLAPAECWGLLEGEVVGRLGVLFDSAPEIYPVNYAVDDCTIVFRTDPGSKLHGLGRSPSVCFEVDRIDAKRAMGWSVLVKGHAVDLSDPAPLQRARALPLRLWTVGDKGHWIQIRPREVTGRRIHRRRNEVDT